MSFVMWSLVIAVLTALTCSLCGVFLVVKRESLVSEALSHAVLPGIVVAFLIFEDRSSPWLIISAGLMGLLMVWLVQLIKQTRLVEGEAALGIVFSALFSVGIILASLKLGQTHFHAECIIDGNLASAALKSARWGDTDLGPKAFYVMLATFMLAISFIAAFYKELKLTMFDDTLAKGLGLRPELMHFVWLGIVSITTVAAFEIAGSILVVALMIAPPAAAFLLTRRISAMLITSCLIGVVCSIAGFYVGYFLEVAPTGPIASITGFAFLLAVAFSPRQGLLAKHRNRGKLRKELFQQLLLARLTEPKASNAQNSVFTVEQVFPNVAWTRQQFQQALANCRQQRWIEGDEEKVSVTETGRIALQQMLANN